jgi:hypothetical protein
MNLSLARRLPSEANRANPVQRTAARMNDAAQLHRLAALWKSKLDWDFQVANGGFRDPAGRDGLVFGVTPAKVLVFGKSPYSQTRYHFTA